MFTPGNEKLAEEIELCNKIESLLNEPMKNRVFAISQTWVDQFRNYSTKLKTLKKEDPEEFAEVKSLRPGPVENFDLVYLSPKYQEKVGKPEQKFNDWA
jgi:hypothetical protein